MEAWYHPSIGHMARYVARRKFLATLGGAAAAGPLAARAQQPAKVARIGYLGLGPASARTTQVEALRAGLRDLGWVEGKNVIIEFRWADKVDELPARRPRPHASRCHIRAAGRSRVERHARLSKKLP
jgi:putative tryptophan/tyrosine transport system substrate-binding protein